MKKLLVTSVLVVGLGALSACSDRVGSLPFVGDKCDPDAPVWECKVETTQDVKIGIITDTQIKATRYNTADDRPEAPRYIRGRYRQPMDFFVRQMRESFMPDFIVVPGDIIEGTGRDAHVAAIELSLVKDLMVTVGVPVWWVIGNHEVRALTKDQFKEALGIDYLNTSFEQGDYKFILVDTNVDGEGNDIVPGEYYTRGNVSDSTLAWLEEELKTEKRVYVFLHHPPLLDAPNKTPSGFIKRGQELRDLFGKYNVDAVFGGHIERLAYNKIDGVEYFSLPGTIKSDLHLGSYFELELIDGVPQLAIYYQDADGKYISIADYRAEANRIVEEQVYEKYGEEQDRLEEEKKILEARQQEIDAQRGDGVDAAFGITSEDEDEDDEEDEDEDEDEDENEDEESKE